ncbi:hypothetical protein T4D_7500 [Trichinella pseudospiralis]|uniref:Uncharacterized protein n=1 Tax=Trichinella pseudospiralis TaxID=6337 RepID=A0A0V1DMX0_TRIPS|nr:hypothetical protein T4D_5830 [Trichinella pseudospiralis]KRY62772.1 hypothetical protein T4D_7500 [Trichinella pseudospiralis]
MLASKCFSDFASLFSEIMFLLQFLNYDGST